jgi:hypothetical protein
MQFIDDKFVLGNNLAERTVNEFKKTVVFNDLLNKAAKFAYEVSIGNN